MRLMVGETERSELERVKIKKYFSRQAERPISSKKKKKNWREREKPIKYL